MFILGSLESALVLVLVLVFVLVLIELFLLCVTAEALRTNID